MLKQLIITFALVSIFGAFALAQEHSATDKKEKMECSKGCCSGHDSQGTMSMAYMGSDSTHNEHHEMKSDNKMHGMHHEMKSESMSDSSIVRKDVIDLAAIDKNKDGKVFQDQMDWNVISDKPGQCPLCGMKLKEVSLEKAKANLIKHGYKVKEK